MAQGVHTPTRWSLAWGTLTCPVPHARNCTFLAHCGAAWWEGEVGPHQPKLGTSPLGQPGSRGWEGVLLWAPPSTPSLSGQVATPSSLTHFSGVRGQGKHPRGSYLNAWSDLCQTHMGPTLWCGQPPLKRVSWCHHLPWSSAGMSKMCQITSAAALSALPLRTGRAGLLGPLSQLFPWKMNLVQSTGDWQGTLPWVWGGVPQRWELDTTLPLEAALPKVNVPNHIWSHWLCTTLANLGELGCLAPCLNFSQKNESQPNHSKLTGELPNGEGNLSWRWQVHTSIPLEAALPRVNVPNHVCPQFSLKNQLGPICLKLTGDLCQVVGRHASKMASGYHPPPWSSTAPS